MKFKPCALLLGLALTFACVHFAFLSVRLITEAVLSMPIGVLFGMPSLHTMVPALLCLTAMCASGRLSYHLIDRSGVFPDAATEYVARA